MASNLVRYGILSLALWLSAAPAPARAAGEPDILPVEQAFQLQTRVVSRDQVELSWKIAKDYYLYRDRIKVKPETAGVEVLPTRFPDGEQKHDDLFGDVIVYHGKLVALQPIKVDPALTQAALKITVQGCHEVDPKICYPPHASHVILALPAAATASAEAADPLAPNPAAGANPLLVDEVPAAGADELPLPPEQAFVFETIASTPEELLLRFTMPKGYYLYRDRTRVLSVDGGLARAGALQWPKGVMHKDEHFGNVEVYFDLVEVPLPLTRLKGDAGPLALTVELQGCEEDGICYPPMKRSVQVELPPSQKVAATATAAEAPSAGTGASDESDMGNRFAAALTGAGLFKVLLLFFIAGLGLAFTPCVFPMIPILTGIIAGAGDNLSTRRAFVLSFVYVLASALVFTAAGVIAGLAGKNLQAMFQDPWILGAFAGVFVLLALSMFGFYELQVPSSWQTKLSDLSNRQQGGSLTGVAVMGALSALIVGPCVAPPLAAAVVYIGQQQDPWLGGTALFALGLGMGVPLIAAGTGLGQFLPRAGAWMDGVKHVFGVLFLLLALWMLERFVEPRWILLMLGALLVACGVYLDALERLPQPATGWQRLRKSIGVLLLVLGLAEFGGGLAGGKDYLAPLAGIAGSGAAGEAQHGPAFRRIKSGDDLDAALAAAKQQGQPVMLDFYADWCVSCKEMERDTFTDASVQAQMSRFVLLQADVTANDDTDAALMKRLSIVGPPATLFYGRDGAAHAELRLDGFEAAPKFAARLERALR
jgi:thiol:disulfide interchange protein DsbD